MLNNTAGAHGNEIYYNFDSRRFISDLNGVTKLLIALGTGTATLSIHQHALYTHIYTTYPLIITPIYNNTSSECIYL